VAFARTAAEAAHEMKDVGGRAIAKAYASVDLCGSGDETARGDQQRTAHG